MQDTVPIAPKRAQRHGTVHGARIEIVYAEPLRERARRYAFARSGGAVDGDDVNSCHIVLPFIIARGAQMPRVNV